MEDYSEVFVGMDVSKSRIAIALAEGGGAREARFLGEIEASEASVAKLVRRLSAKYGKPTFCYEAGPTGYGLYRLIGEFGHECRVAAPSLIPRKPGDRVKTNRRDALSLARLLRAGELTSVWAPDERHEVMRDLVRTVEKMRGAINSPVKLKIVRGPKKEVKEFTIVRDLIRVQSVRSHVEDGDIGYIRVTQFTEQTADGLKAAMEKLHNEIPADKFKGYILDLRNNPVDELRGDLDFVAGFPERFLRADKTGRAKRARVGYLADVMSVEASHELLL